MKLKKLKQDMIMFSVVLAASVIFLRWIIPNQIYVTPVASQEIFSPDTFPKFAAGIMLAASACGLVLTAADYWKTVKREGRPVVEKKRYTPADVYSALVPYMLFLLSVLYAFLYNHLGAVWSTVIVPPLALAIVKCRKWSRYLIVYAFAAALYVLFKYALHVPLR